MWPETNTGVPLSLAQRRSLRPASRTCPTLPGPEFSSLLYKVWIESTMTRPGLMESILSITATRSVSGSISTPSPAKPKRSERSFICWGDSSPLTYRTFWPLAAMYWASCRRRVDLPTPGSPARSATEPGTTPPPSTRLSSGDGRGSRGWSSEEMDDNSTTSVVAFVASHPGLPLGARGATAVSTRGVLEPHPWAGQKPDHLANSFPQDGHMKTV